MAPDAKRRKFLTHKNITMICKSFSNLALIDKFMFVGKLTHACMNDCELFELACKIIEEAEDRGLYENVKFMPKQEHEYDTQD